MPNEELKIFINKMRAAGKTDSETTTALKTAGWPEADILAAVDSETQPPSLVSPTKLKSKTWFWVLIILAAIGFGSYLTLRILPNLLVRSLKKPGQTFVTYPSPTSSSLSLVPSAIPQAQVEQETNWVSLDFKGLSVKIPSVWQEKTNESGKLFVSQDGKVVLVVTQEGKQCFSTLKDYIDGVVGIASSEENFAILAEPKEEVVNGITTYRILIGSTHGDRQVITNSMLFKGEVNNFGVVISIDKSSGEKYLSLATKVFDSVRINDSSVPIIKICRN